MSSEQQLQTTIERLVSGVRKQLEADMRAHADELARAAAAERAKAIEQATEAVRRQAQEQVAQLRESARKQNDELRRSAETQIAELRRLLEDLKRNAQQQIDAARKTVETEIASARAQADQQVAAAKRAAAESIEAAQRAAEVRLADAARELDELRRELQQTRTGAEQSRRDGDAARQAAEQSRSDLAAAHRALEQLRRAAAARPAAGHDELADGVRSIDEAESLSDVFERLTHAAVRHADRAALLLVKDDGLREWRTIGFGGRTPDETRQLSFDAAGMAATAVREARAMRRTGSDGPPLPSFAAESDVADAAVCPIAVAGAVVAVVYADLSSAPGAQRAGWAAALDVLARHAGRTLEAITIQQAAGLRPLARVARDPRSGAAPGGIQP